MKRSTLMKLASMLICAIMLISVFASCDSEPVQGAQGIQGEKGEKGDKGDQGEPGETGAQGEKGDKGDQGEPGETGAQGEKGDKGDQGEPGESGAQGEKGNDGVGIEKIEKTASSGATDTYTITLTNGMTQTFEVTNGSCTGTHRYSVWTVLLSIGGTEIEYRECSVCKDTQLRRVGSADPDANGSANNIVELNKDREPFIIQAAHGRTEAFGDAYEPLTFIHTSDMHASIEPWNRMVYFTNYYKSYIDFVLHTGDYCGGSLGAYVDMYGSGMKCEVPILNAVGNHDAMPADNPTAAGIGTAPKSEVFEKLFGTSAAWGVTFMEGEYSMAYYKDFPDSNIRLIVLDLYYDADAQLTWLRGLLDEARADGMHVITAMHEPSDKITEPVDTPFHSINAWDTIDNVGRKKFETELYNHIAAGGILIANLAGHDHHDSFGYTDSGILNIIVENGNSFKYWCDADRAAGTRTIDSFNVVSVDANLGTISLIRIGNNTDNFMREKNVLCYDYINKRIISGASTSGSGSVAEEEPTVKHLDADAIAARPSSGSYMLESTEVLADADSTSYNRIITKTGVSAAQMLWTRIGENGEGLPYPEINPIEVGKSKYLVLKMRGEANIEEISFKLGTITGKPIFLNLENQKTATVKLPQADLAADRWTTFVIDLSATMAGGWVADTDGTYTVSYLQITFNDYTNKFARAMTLDFAYMHFADDWAEIAETVDCETVQVITADNTSVTYNKNGTLPS